MSEAQEQIAVIEYCELKGYPVFHIPNEGKRSIYTGANLKRQGLRKGVPDLCIPRAVGDFHGLYIEMKSKEGKLSREQMQWLQLLQSEGFCALCCYGADKAIELIELYMAGRVKLATPGGQ